MERCPSGLRCTPGTRVWMKIHREFESPPLRIKIMKLKRLIFFVLIGISLCQTIDRIGSVEKILIDIVDGNEGWSLGRSYRDAPEIDNYVKINQQLEIGEIYNVKIDEAYEYDVVGSLLNG